MASDGEADRERIQEAARRRGAEAPPLSYETLRTIASLMGTANTVQFRVKAEGDHDPLERD